MMKWWVIAILLLVVIVIGSLTAIYGKGREIVSPVTKILEKPLEKYTIDNLARREYKSEVFLDEPTATRSASSGQAFTAYKFHFDSDGRKVTGLAHIPKKCGEENKCPVIIQFRGYVEREAYQPGVGTKRTAEVFAKNGFVSLAPDGLGYGGSDNPSEDVFEERFQTYTMALNLLAGIEKWPVANGQIGMWGHSNGGQIALTVLEILSGKRRIPTVLWAPVSKPFPYSILYYTDEAEDRGKALRKKLAKFEQDYDVELYSTTNYLGRIDASLQIHQGSADEAVPKKWTDELVKELKIQGSKLKAGYYLYPGADHNMVPAWNTAVQRDIDFFKRQLK